VLDEAAETLKSHQNVTVSVNGYCDAIGSVGYNLKLSERRANAVVKYLADHGVAEGRLSPAVLERRTSSRPTRHPKDAPRTAGSKWCRTNSGQKRVGCASRDLDRKVWKVRFGLGALA
jgi:OmpA family